MKIEIDNYIVNVEECDGKNIKEIKDCVKDAINQIKNQKHTKDSHNESYYNYILKNYSGKTITTKNAEKISNDLDISQTKLFDILDDMVADLLISGNNETLVYHINDSKIKDEGPIGSDAFDDLLDRAQLLLKEGHSIEDAVLNAVDEGLIYNDDILDLAKVYLSSDKIFEIEDWFYEDLLRDLRENLEKSQDFEDSKPNDKKSNELNDKEYKKYDVVTVYKDNNEETISYNNKEIALNEAKRDAKRDNVEYVEVVRYIIDDDTNEEIKDIIWTSEETKDSKPKITREPRKVAPRKV